MSVISGVVGAISSKKAADKQAEAAEKSVDAQLQMYNQSREDQTPWRTAGTNALATMEGLLGGDMSSFKTSPGYRFRLQEGINALDRSASARGNLMGGAQIKAVQERGEGLAAQEYGDYWNRLASLAGLGQTSVQSTGQLGANTANQMGQAYMNAGNARASGYINQANALSGASNSAMNALAYYNAYNKFGGTGAGAGAGAGAVGGGYSMQPYDESLWGA